MIAQLISNTGAYIQKKRAPTIFRSCFRLGKQILTSVWDPAVEQEIGAYALKMPLSHPLPDNLALFALYDQQIAPIGGYLLEKYSDLRMIDVGANIGDTAALVKSDTDIPVLCVEGNPRMLKYLRKNVELMGQAEIAETFLGERDGSMEANLVHAPGSASIDTNASTASTITVSTMETVCRQHPKFRNAKLLKIDTDGYDLQVLRASLPYIERARPAILFEYDPNLLHLQGEEPKDIFELLQSLGYSNFLFYENSGNFMLGLSAVNVQEIADVAAFFECAARLDYCDILALHREDQDLAEPIRQAERVRCLEVRKSQSK